MNFLVGHKPSLWLCGCVLFVLTLRTTGLPSLMSWASIMATLWSMVVEWSVLSAEFPTNVPKAKTAAHLTCRDTERNVLMEKKKYKKKDCASVILTDLDVSHLVNRSNSGGVRAHSRSALIN